MEIKIKIVNKFDLPGFPIKLNEELIIERDDSRLVTVWVIEKVESSAGYKSMTLMLKKEYGKERQADGDKI